MLLPAGLLALDDHSVQFDAQVDFSTFKTFSVRDGSLTSDRPEVNSPITAKKLTDVIRATLTAKGLKEAADPADLLVEHAVMTQDYAIGSFGRANPVGGQRASRGGRNPQIARVDFSDATLVIDLKAGNPRALVWRGVYNATDEEPAKLSEKLQKSATELLAAFPPKRKK